MTDHCPGCDIRDYLTRPSQPHKPGCWWVEIQRLRAALESIPDCDHCASFGLASAALRRGPP